MRVFSDPQYQNVGNTQKVLFVPGIEHDNRDLASLQEEVRNCISFVTVEKKDVPFDSKRRKEWESHFRAHLLNTGKERAVTGLVGHSFGCFRTLALLQEGLHADVVHLINPPMNTIGALPEDPENAYRKFAANKKRATTTHTEERLSPLVLELDDDVYDEFMLHHTEHERLTGDPFEPTQITEFKTLSSSEKFPDLLRSTMQNLGQTACPVIIYRSLCDQWDIKQWGDLPLNVQVKTFENAGHYLHLKFAETIGNHFIEHASSTNRQSISHEEYRVLLQETGQLSPVMQKVLS